MDLLHNLLNAFEKTIFSKFERHEIQNWISAKFGCNDLADSFAAKHFGLLDESVFHDGRYALLVPKALRYSIQAKEVWLFTRVVQYLDAICSKKNDDLRELLFPIIELLINHFTSDENISFFEDDISDIEEICVLLKDAQGDREQRLIGKWIKKIVTGTSVSSCCWFCRLYVSPYFSYQSGGFLDKFFDSSVSSAQRLFLGECLFQHKLALMSFYVERGDISKETLDYLKFNREIAERRQT